MDVHLQDIAVSEVAAAIAVPARTRMLCALMDGHARTSTELSAVAEVSASTGSEHLLQLKAARLVRVHAQGRHRYYRLKDQQVAHLLESLMVVGHERPTVPAFVPSAPCRLRAARTCYDHLAGTLGVRLHDALLTSGWLVPVAPDSTEYRITADGHAGLLDWGVDSERLACITGRRRFAFGCMDWSSRRLHLAGALGASLLEAALGNAWLRQDLDSRALTLTHSGRCQLTSRLAIDCSVLGAPESRL